MRKWVAVLVAAVAVVGVVALVLTQRNQEEAHAQEVAQWQQDLQTWESSQAEALIPPEGPLLSEMITGAAMSDLPSAAPVPVADIDDVNAACTRLTAYTGAVDDAPGPPAGPANADFTEDERRRFEADLHALQEFRDAIEADGDLIRRFCGTYPLLITAHTDGGPEAAQMMAEGLATQCPLDELAQACQELQAAAAGETATVVLDQEHIATVINEELTSAEETISTAAETFQDRMAT